MIEDAHIGGWVGLAIAGLFFSGKLLELVRIFVEKKRRLPLKREADVDRKEYIDQIRVLTAKIDALNPKVAKLEGQWEGVNSGLFERPPKKDDQ